MSRFAKVKDLMQRYVDERRAVGVHPTVLLRGNCVYSECVGYRGQAAKPPLGEEGRFHLADPLKEYIPAFDHMMVMS